MRRQQGFSLIELLIVVAVIGIIAAIAVPNLMRSRRAAQEAAAISTLRTIATAQITYAATVGNGDFGQLSDLASQDVGLLDSVIGQGQEKDGYIYNCEVGEGTFDCTADPQDAELRQFFVAEDCVIRVGGDREAPPLGGSE